MSDSSDIRFSGNQISKLDLNDKVNTTNLNKTVINGTNTLIKNKSVSLNTSNESKPINTAENNNQSNTSNDKVNKTKFLNISRYNNTDRERIGKDD